MDPAAACLWVHDAASYPHKNARSGQFRRQALRACLALDGMQTSRLCLGALLAVRHASRLYILIFTNRQCHCLS